MSLLSIQDASRWATDYLEKEVTPNNISYLVQYGKVKKLGENGSTLVDVNDLKKYYESWRGKREVDWKAKLGNDLNWALSFDNLREKDTTKHVHRLHPYKGKFIPQLVEYFIDSHTDDFKTSTYFKADEIILFDNELFKTTAEFNNEYFPSPEFKYKIQRGQINESKYSAEKEEEFLKIYNNLVNKYGV